MIANIKNRKIMNDDLEKEFMSSWWSPISSDYYTGKTSRVRGYEGDSGVVFVADRVGNCIDIGKNNEEGYCLPFIGKSEGGNGFQNVTIGDVLQLEDNKLGVYVSKVNEDIYAVALLGNPEMAFYNSDGLILDDNFEPIEQDNRKIMRYKTK